MSATIQIKICGLTKVDQAVECVALGADAIGLVFYPRSPRFVSDSLARTIADEISADARLTGVFVDEAYETIMQKVEKCKLTAVQGWPSRRRINDRGRNRFVLHLCEPIPLGPERLRTVA